MSERLLGAVIGVHGDDKGLVLPPAIAPFQVVIVPILAKGNVEEILLSAGDWPMSLELKVLGPNLMRKMKGPGANSSSGR